MSPPVSQILITCDSFQAYTACTVLLYFTSQKKLHSSNLDDAQEELERARICLDALTFTEAYDGLEKRFYRILSEHYETLTGASHRGKSPHHVASQQDAMTVKIEDTATSEPSRQFSIDQTFSIPSQNGAKLAEVSRSLLEMLRLPVRRADSSQHEALDRMVLP